MNDKPAYFADEVPHSLHSLHSKSTIIGDYSLNLNVTARHIRDVADVAGVRDTENWYLRSVRRGPRNVRKAGSVKDAEDGGRPEHLEGSPRRTNT